MRQKGFIADAKKAGKNSPAKEKTQQTGKEKSSPLNISKQKKKFYVESCDWGRIDWPKQCLSLQTLLY